MKRCEKCGIENPSDKNYCPKCGEKLVDFNVCQRCGESVELEDTYCSNCGYQIEKESFCPKCNAKLEGQPKFCPECGSKITKPVIKIAPPRIVHKHEVSPKGEKSGGEQVSTVSPLARKISFFVMSGLTLLFMLLFLVGSFGDVYSAYYAETGSAPIRLNQTIAYFFKADGFYNIRNLAYKNYGSYSAGVIAYLGLFIFAGIEYSLWLLAITFTIVGLIKSLVRFIKGITRKTYNYNCKTLITTVILVLPYPLFFAMEYCQGTVATSGIGGVEATMRLGWGTGMILVCSIVAIACVGIYKIIFPILSKDKFNFIGNVIFYPLAVALFIFFTLSFSHFVDLRASATVLGISATLKGNVSVYQNYVDTLGVLGKMAYYSSYSYYGSTTSATIPGAVYWAIVPVIFAIVTGFCGLFMLGKLLKEKKIGFYVFGALTFVFALTTYILALSNTKELASYNIISLKYDAQYYKFSTLGIFVLVFIALCVGGAIAKTVLSNRKHA